MSCSLLLLAVLLALAASWAQGEAGQFSPSCVGGPQGGAILTVVGTAASSAACAAAAAALSSNGSLAAGGAPLLSFGAAFLSPFACVSCVPPAAGGPCNAELQAELRPPSLLQWYANAWAAPVNGTYFNGMGMVWIHEV